jgi:hypothetical protein
MASKLVIDAVEARLTAQWSSCPVFGLNDEAETPTDGSPFLAVQYPVANEEQISVGSPGSQVFRETGGFRLVLSVERTRGMTQGIGWVDDLRTLFRAQQFGGISCLGASPAFQDDSIDNGNYVLLTVVVEYYADMIG